MGIFRLMMYSQWVEKEKKKDSEEHLSKKAKSAGHELKQGKGSRSFFEKRTSNYATSSASALGMNRG